MYGFRLEMFDYINEERTKCEVGHSKLSQILVQEGHHLGVSWPTSSTIVFKYLNQDLPQPSHHVQNTHTHIHAVKIEEYEVVGDGSTNLASVCMF